MFRIFQSSNPEVFLPLDRAGPRTYHRREDYLKIMTEISLVTKSCRNGIRQLAREQTLPDLNSGRVD
jgi:hypothetical protein